MYFLAAARESGTRVIGPNTAGLVTPGADFVEFMLAFSERIFRPGRIGVISRSGSPGTLICLNVTQAGHGISAFIGIGGDSVLGDHHSGRSCPPRYSSRHRGDGIVGEIGGTVEEEATEYAQGMHKPVAAFIAEAASPPGRRMGHAGAIVMGGRGTYEAKQQAAVAVVSSPSKLMDVLWTADA